MQTVPFYLFTLATLVGTPAVMMAPAARAQAPDPVEQTGHDVMHTSAVAHVAELPHLLMLAPNYPNPFNPSTEIGFTVPAEGRAVLSVHDVLGHEVAVLFDAVAQPGRQYRVTFDGHGLASGLYLFRLRFGGEEHVGTMLLAK